MILTLAQVAIGGAIGSALRFLTVAFIGAPLAILLVNVLGSFAMGMCFVLLSTRLSPLVMTGVLGGFTTFSAFSLDALQLWEKGEAMQALAYVAGSVVLSLAAVVAGVMVARALT